MSSDALEAAVDLEPIVDRSFVGDVGIDTSAALLAFTNAVHCGEPDLESSRTQLLDLVGADGLVEASATIAVFNGLVRVADGTGIQLDQGFLTYSEADRARLGLDSMAGVANTTGSAGDALIESISELFG